MTLALLMFIYGMGRYFKRIYQRFALDSDHYITGKFEFGDSAHEAQSTVTQPADPGLGEVLSGGGSIVACMQQPWLCRRRGAAE